MVQVQSKGSANQIRTEEYPLQLLGDGWPLGKGEGLPATRKEPEPEWERQPALRTVSKTLATKERAPHLSLFFSPLFLT